MNDQRHRDNRSHDVTRGHQQVIDDFSNVMDTIMRSMPRVLSRKLVQHRITLLQFYALREIASCEQDIDMSTISTMTGFPASSITSIIDRLDHLGLVERRHDATDRRRVVATITPHGASVLEQLNEERRELLSHMFAQSTTEDLVTCVTVFRDVQNHVDELLET